MRWPWSRRPTPPVTPPPTLTPERLTALHNVVAMAIETYDQALELATVTDGTGPLHPRETEAYVAITTRPALVLTALVEQVPDAELRRVVAHLFVLAFCVLLD